MELKKYLTGLCHIGIPTNDMEATIDFYKTIGFTIALDTINQEADERVVFFQLNNLVLESYQNNNAVMKRGAVDHIAINVTDIESVYADILEKNLTMLDSEIRFLPFWEKGVRFFNIEGPNKEVIEFSQRL